MASIEEYLPCEEAYRARRKPSSGDDDAPKAVRAWAEANGVAVSARGRISAKVQEQYKAANQ